MGRPNKPSWHDAGKCFRVRIAGKVYYAPREITRYEPPLMGGVPRRAWDWLFALKERMARAVADLAAPDVYTLCELYLAHLDAQRASKNVTEGHYEAVRSHLSKFVDFRPGDAGEPFAGRRASSLGVSDLEAFAGAMADRHSAHYVADLCASVQAAWNWAAKPVRDWDPSRLIPENGMKGFRPPRPPKQSDRYQDMATIRAFLRWAWRRANARTDAKGRRRILERRFDLIFVRMLWFLALTGARPGEACGARWEDVREREGVIRLREWKNARATGRFREIHLTPRVSRLLGRIARLEEHHPEFIFTHTLGRGQAGTALPEQGSPWNSVALSRKIREWRAAAVAAGVPIVAEGAGRFTAYLLRHSWITDGLHHGLTESEVAELAGTSARMVAETYGHIQRRHLAEKAAQLDESRRVMARNPSLRDG